MHSLAAIFRRRANQEPLAPLARVPHTASCRETIEAMAAERASAALVVDAGGRPLGIVTEQDVVRRIAFKLAPETPIATVMTAPVETIQAEDYVFHAIARMRRRRLRHMPMTGDDGRILGVLDLHRAYAGAIAGMVALIDELTHEATLDGLKEVKKAQVALADALFEETLPAPEIQALLSDINRDIHARIAGLAEAAMREAGWGDPPAKYCLIVMGSGGRGENFLYPDQDNGIVIDEYPDDAHLAIDAWFVAFAERLTLSLAAIGFPLCKGNVMATNPLWRKTRAQWREQTAIWFRQRLGPAARYADIFFDFAPAAGEAAYAAELRAHVTPLVAENAGFLRDIHDLQANHTTALGWFGRIRGDTEQRGMVNVKYRGTLPLVDAVRLLGLKHRVGESSTAGRIAALAARGIVGPDERDDLAGAFANLTRILLRQQLNDFKAGHAVGNFVPLRALSRWDRRRLIDSFRSIEALRERVAVEIGGRAV